MNITTFVPIFVAIAEGEKEKVRAYLKSRNALSPQTAVKLDEKIEKKYRNYKVDMKKYIKETDRKYWLNEKEYEKYKQKQNRIALIILGILLLIGIGVGLMIGFGLFAKLFNL